MIRSLDRCDMSLGGEISIAGVVGVIVLFRVLHEGDEYFLPVTVSYLYEYTGIAKD